MTTRDQLYRDNARLREAAELGLTYVASLAEDDYDGEWPSASEDAKKIREALMATRRDDLK